MTFADDLRSLRDGTGQRTQATMRLRHWRGFLYNSTWPVPTLHPPTDYFNHVALYRHDAGPRERPVVTFFADRLLDLTAVAQRSLCTVTGWPVPGRAVLIDVDGLRFESLTACRPSMLGRRFGADR